MQFLAQTKTKSKYSVRLLQKAAGKCSSPQACSAGVTPLTARIPLARRESIELLPSASVACFLIAESFWLIVDEAVGKF